MLLRKHPDLFVARRPKRNHFVKQPESRTSWLQAAPSGVAQESTVKRDRIRRVPLAVRYRNTETIRLVADIELVSQQRIHLTLSLTYNSLTVGRFVDDRWKSPKPVEVAVLLSVSEVCERTTLSKTRIYEELTSGRLRSLRVGARRLVPEAALEEWVENLLDENG